MHVGSIRQTVQIEEIIDRQAIRTGDRATIRYACFPSFPVASVADECTFSQVQAAEEQRVHHRRIAVPLP